MSGHPLTPGGRHHADASGDGPERQIPVLSLLPEAADASERTHRIEFWIVALLLLGIGAVSIGRLWAFEANAAFGVQSHDVIEHTLRVMNHTVDLQVGMAGFLITGDEASVEAYRIGREALAEDLRALRSAAHLDERLRERFGALESLIEARLAVGDRLIAVRREQGAAAAQALLRDGEIAAQVGRTREAADALLSDERRTLESHIANARSAARGALLATATLIGACLFSLWRAESRIRADRALRMAAQRRVEEVNAALKTQNVALDLARERAEAADLINSAILANAGNAIVTVTPDLVISSFNPAAERMLGYAADEVVGKSEIARLLDAAEIEKLARAIVDPRGASHASSLGAFAAEVRRGGQRQYAWSLVRKDGSRFPALIEAAALRDANGDVTGYLGLAVDITERARMLDELASRNDDLKAFAYTVSHDLKAPLRGIAGYARELEREHEKDLSKRARFCVEQIRTASQNLDQLIEDLLVYARLDAEDPESSETVLRPLIERILAERSHAIKEFGVEVRVDVPAVSLRVWERGLHQVLGNLVGNALKYSRNSRPPRVSITAEASASAFRIVVADNGIGFDMQHRDRIFGLFHRLVRSDEFEGTGAGLAIVRKLMDKLGGSVRCESAPGDGARFIVELPASIVVRGRA